jgi:hypothetical protein
MESSLASADAKIFEIGLMVYINKQIKYNLLPPMFDHAQKILGEYGYKKFLDLSENPGSEDFVDFVNNNLVLKCEM